MFQTLKFPASLATALASTALVAANTSVQQPEGLVDLTTSDAAKAFSVIKPKSTDWLAYNLDNVFQYSLDYTHAFDNGGKYDRTDRCIIQASAADFGYSFDEPTVINSYKIYLPKDDGINANDRAPGKWTFEGSDDKESWTTLDTRGTSESESNWGATSDTVAARFYTFDNTKPYRHYRLNVSQTVKTDAGYLQLAELEFFGALRPKQIDTSSFASHQEYKIAGLDEGVTLNRLPVLVRFNPSEMTFAREDHADLAFTQGEDDEALPYEVDTWTDTQALVWVCVKEATRGGAFTMHWGATDDYASDNLYAWSDYVSVVHFNGDASDSGKYTNVNSSSADAGFIGKGVSGPKTQIKEPFKGLVNQSKCALSAWMRPTANGTNVRILSTKAQYSDPGMELLYVKDAGIYLRGDNSNAQIIYAAANDVIFTKDVWTHYTTVLDMTGGAIYKNGQVMTDPGTINAASLAGKTLMMGGYNVTEEGKGDDSNIAGTMDELRIYNGIPSAARVKAEYQAMADEGFLTTETIPSTVEVTSIVSAADAAKVTVSGNVQLGENEDKVTVVIGVGTTEAANDRTYEIADCVTGAFTKEIADLTAGRYYFTVALKGIAGSATTPQLLRVGVLPDVEWTGAGNGWSWSDPNNWNTGAVPLEDDSVLFGDSVRSALTVTGDAESKAKTVKMKTPYALRLETVAVLNVEIDETAAEVNVISPLTINLMDGSDVGTWNVPEGKTLRVGNLTGRASLVKTGAGTVNLAGQQCDRAVGTTEVREGTLIFTANRQLGTALSVGGGEIPAVAKSENAGDKFNPFDANQRPVHVLRNGLLDLSSDGSSGLYWIGQSLVGQFTVDAGGTLNLGQRRFAYAGLDQVMVLNGTLISDQASRLDIERGAITVGASAEKPVAIDCPVYVQYQYAHDRPCYGTFEVADGKTLSVNGVISANWDPRDGIDKKGEGILRLTKGNRYGGGSNDAQGRTTVYAGTLLVDNASGSGTGYSRVHVNGGATLGGIGTIGGVNTEITAPSKVTEKGAYVRLVAAGSETAPAMVWPGTIDDATGQHINGVLTVGSEAISHPVTFGAHSTLKLTFGKTVISDALVVHGTVAINETDTKLVLEPNCDLKDLHGGTFTVLSATDGITGDFSEIVAPKGWHVNKVMGKVMTEEGETEKVVAITVSMAGRGLAMIIR